MIFGNNINQLSFWNALAHAALGCPEDHVLDSLPLPVSSKVRLVGNESASATSFNS
jgi:hypothetical protein